MTPAVSPRRAHTQDRLIDAAIALFAEKGVLASSVEEICERAGFTRGAFYSNFDSKDELMVAALERKGQEILRAATEATQSVPGRRIEPRSADDVIRQAALVFQASHPLDPEWLLARSEMRLYALRNPPVREPFLRVEQRIDALLLAAISEVIERQQVTLAVPAEHLIALLDGYQESQAERALMSGQEAFGPAWAERLAEIIRALVNFPAQ